MKVEAVHAVGDKKDHYLTTFKHRYAIPLIRLTVVAPNMRKLIMVLTRTCQVSSEELHVN